jgi:sugar lactone lactonase YvrE
MKLEWNANALVRRVAVVATLVMAITACGGGGGGGGAPAPANPAAGEIKVFAGLLQQRGAADGTGAAAEFNEPVDVALDAQGNAYVADSLNHTIRKVTPEGVVTTVAGIAGMPGAADGPAAQARFSSPAGVAVTPTGDVFVADSANHVIRKIDPSGMVTTVAGAVGESGDADGPGDAARFQFPHDLAADAQGNVYIVDRGRAVRRLGVDGTVHRFAVLGAEGGSMATGVAVDGAGVVYVSEAFGLGSSVGQVRRFDANGFGLPWGNAPNGIVNVPRAIDVAAGASGDVVVLSSGVIPLAPSFSAIFNSVHRITSNGSLVLVAGADGPDSFGNVDGAGASARFFRPQGLAMSSTGRIVVADLGNAAIRAIDTLGRVTTLAGGTGRGTADGPVEQARFWDPFDIEATADGTLWLSDLGPGHARRIGPDGMVSTPNLGPSLTDPRFGLTLTAARDGTLFVRASGCLGCASLYAVATGGEPRFVTELPNARAMVPAPGGGIFYADDTTLYRVSPDGVRTQIASGLATPQDLAVDASGVVYVAEFTSHTVRAVDPSGSTRVVAGTPGQAGAADGSAAASRLNNPRALAADDAGNVYVADATTIRRIGADGQVRTIVSSANAAPLVRAAGRVKRMTWHAGMLYATVDNAILSISVP